MATTTGRVKAPAPPPAAEPAPYRRYLAPCYALAQCVLGPGQRSAQVVQEVFAQLRDDPEPFGREEADRFVALMALTHEKSVALLRQVRPVSAHRDLDPDLGLPDPTVAAALPSGRGHVALQALPRAERQVLLLAYFGGLTHDDIARLLDLDVRVVRARLLRGMQRLNEALPAPLAPSSGCVG